MPYVKMSEEQYSRIKSLVETWKEEENLRITLQQFRGKAKIGPLKEAEELSRKMEAGHMEAAQEVALSLGYTIFAIFRDSNTGYAQDSIATTILDEYKNRGKVPAIRETRRLTGLGLKEAKCFVEFLCEGYVAKKQEITTAEDDHDSVIMSVEEARKSREENWPEGTVDDSEWD